MIGLLTGTLVDRSPTGAVLVDVNGVGYEVLVTGSTLGRLGENGKSVTLRIHTRVREDAITLFGFLTADEKRCFDVLVSTHGVGPSVAQSVLTVYSPLEVRQIVASEDGDSLARVPGIGKKTAARMIVELKNRLDIDLDSPDSGGVVIVDSSTRGVRDEVMAGLAALGYSPDETRAALAGIELNEDSSVSSVMKLALKNLAKKSTR